MPALDKIYLDISSLRQTWNDVNHQLKSDIDNTLWISLQELR